MVSLDPFTQFLRDAVSGLGFELVDVRTTGPRQRRAVKIRMDRAGSVPGDGVTSGDCTRIARALRQTLEADWPDDQVAALEVSSPGVERPVRWPEHWRRFVGARVRVRSDAFPGRPTVVIAAVPDDDHVRLRLENGDEETVSLKQITEATLVVDWTGAQ